MYGLVNNWLNFVRQSIKHKGLCYLCCSALGRSDRMICTFCRNDLPMIYKACRVCATPIPEGEFCASCIRAEAPYINNTICPFRYTYPVNKLIQDMKFHSRLELAGFFAQSLADHLESRDITEWPQCLVPVPLHSSRLRERGYNQSLELAKQLSQRLDVPVNPDALIRSRNTLPQSALPAKLRKRNINDAFTATRKILTTYDHVVVIDDVITTGTTVNEVARTIKKSGVGRVDVWACARTA